MMLMIRKVGKGREKCLCVCTEVHVNKSSLDLKEMKVNVFSTGKGI